MTKAILRTIIQLLFFAASNAGIFAQKLTVPDESTLPDTIKAFYFFDSSVPGFGQNLIPVDTSLDQFHHYQPLTTCKQFFANTGNTGLAYYPIRFSEPRLVVGEFGIRTFDLYRMTPFNIPYYKTNVPVSKLFYTTGKDKEQIFNGEHYQQVIKNLAIGLRFNIINSTGGYDRQKTDNVSAAFQILFNSTDKRYGIAANYISNRFILRENGGIQDAGSFEENTERDRKRILVKLQSAENRWRESNVYLRQAFHLKKPVTVGADSIINENKRLGTITHSFNYKRLSQVYEDNNPKSGFYPTILIDSVLTLDSLVLHSFNNRVQYDVTLKLRNNYSIALTFGITHIHTRYQIKNIDESYQQFIPHVASEASLGSRLKLNLHHENISGNLSNGDNKWVGNAAYKLGGDDPVRLELQLTRTAVSPPLFYKAYRSNHFNWENDFEKQQSTQQKFSASWRNSQIGINHQRVNGFLYLDTLAEPASLREAVSVYSAFIDSKLRWKQLHFDNLILFQRASDKSAIHLPALALNSSIAIELVLFKGALHTLSGVEVYYNTAWFAPAYMPALRSYYQQSDTQTGDYIFADVFINMRVKRARLFLLLQHANEGLLGYSYYTIPGYPMPDRAFKFGVSWMFYD